MQAERLFQINGEKNDNECTDSGISVPNLGTTIKLCPVHPQVLEADRFVLFKSNVCQRVLSFAVNFRGPKFS